MDHKILLFWGLCAAIPVSAQEVYNSTLGIDSIFGMEMLMTDDGNLIVASSRSGDLIFSGWNILGDSLWTTSHPGGGIISYNRLSHFGKLTTGEIMVGGRDSSLFMNEQGIITQSTPLGAFDILEVGEDSLVSYHALQPLTLRMTDRFGSIVWETPVVFPPGYSTLGLTPGVLTRYDTGVLLFMNLDAPFGFFQTKNFVCKYGLDGTFLDSLTLEDTIGALEYLVGSIPTQDGGALTYAQGGTGCTRLYKTDPLGDTTWTRFICLGLPGDPDWFRADGAVQLDNGHYVLSGYSELDGGLPSATFHLLELDEDGATVCLESLNEPAQPYESNSGIVLEESGRLHIFLTNRFDFEMTPFFKMVGYDQLCLITSSEEHQPLDWSVHVAPTQILLRSDGSSQHYEIHDLSGRIIMRGMVMPGITSIRADHFSPGVYLVSLHDLGNGGRHVKKIVIER